MCLAIPGKILEIHEADGLRMGRLDFGGAIREACLTYVPEAKIGDYAIVHVGFAINMLSEAEALASLETIRQVADLGAELGPEGGAE
jgi:hydrogenase expression/formation protein HypC